MKAALLLVATGERYWGYAERLIDSANRFLFPHQTILFTDGPEDLGVDVKVVVPPAGYPDATLRRYHTFLRQRSILESYDFLIYSDVDMLFVAPVAERDVVTNGLFATEHPGYVGLPGTPETNPGSSAYVARVGTYFCGGFNGGITASYLAMAEAIRGGIDADAARGFTAIWHDESHINRYLLDHPPARILSPSFCFPQGEFERRGGFYGGIWERAGRRGIEPKLVALEKGAR